MSEPSRYRRSLLRRLAIALLDDDQGISEAAYETLRQLLVEADCPDIINQVEATDGRFYLKPEYALRK